MTVTQRRTLLDRALWGLAALGFVLGLYGVYDRLAFGHMNADYGSYIPWGLWVAAYIYFVGISAGITLIIGVGYLLGERRLASVGRLGLWLALVTFMAGMLLIWLDLGHMTRFWRLYLSPNLGSMMGLMAWLYVIYSIGLLLVFWVLLRQPAGSEPPRQLRWLALFGVILTIAFAGGEGALFGVVGARPFWAEGLPQVVFLVTAILGGAAVLASASALFSRKLGEAEAVLPILRWVMIGGIGLTLLLEWAHISSGLYTALPSQGESLNLMLFGPFWWVFWIVLLGIGLLGPLLILVLAKPSRTSVGSAGALVAVGLFGSKLNLVIPGLAVEELAGLERAFTGPGLNFSYMPTSMEWLVLIWVVSLATIIFLAGRRLLPVVQPE